MIYLTPLLLAAKASSHSSLAKPISNKKDNVIKRTKASISSSTTLSLKTTSQESSPRYSSHIVDLIWHEDFVKLYSLVIQIGNLHDLVIRSRKEGKDDASYRHHEMVSLSDDFFLPSSKCYSDVILNGVRHIRKEYPMRRSINNSTRNFHPEYVILNGTFASLDSMMNQNLNYLHEEVTKCQYFIKHKQDSDLSKIVPRTKRKDGKYSAWQKDALKGWVMEHKDVPFATKRDIEKLNRIVNISNQEIFQWYTNQRRNNLRKSLKKNEKPRHFVDFVYALICNRAEKIFKQVKKEMFACLKSTLSGGLGNRRKTKIDNVLSDITKEDVVAANVLTYIRPQEEVVMASKALQKMSLHDTSSNGYKQKMKDSNTNFFSSDFEEILLLHQNLVCSPGVGFGYNYLDKAGIEIVEV